MSRAFATLLLKEVRRILRIWTQTILPPIITTTLYFIVFGTFLADRIGTLEGVSYPQYIAPGLVMMTVITNSFVNASSSLFMERYHQGFNQLLAAPMRSWEIAMGFIFGGVFRGFVTGLLVLIIADWFADLSVAHPVYLMASILLTATLFSSLGFINAVWAKTFDHINLFPSFFLSPAIYLGGVFYSIDSLPEPWKSLSKYNPIVYFIHELRYGMLGLQTYNPLFVVGCIALLVFVSALCAVVLVQRSRTLHP